MQPVLLSRQTIPAGTMTMTMTHHKGNNGLENLAVIGRKNDDGTEPRECVRSKEYRVFEERRRGV